MASCLSSCWSGWFWARLLGSCKARFGMCRGKEGKGLRCSATEAFQATSKTRRTARRRERSESHRMLRTFGLQPSNIPNRYYPQTTQEAEVAIALAHWAKSCEHLNSVRMEAGDAGVYSRNL